jgi:hypothetical protein
VNVSLSGGLSGRPHPAPGPRTRRASAGQRYIRWFFRQYYRDPSASRVSAEWRSYCKVAPPEAAENSASARW